MTTSLPTAQSTAIHSSQTSDTSVPEFVGTTESDVKNFQTLDQESHLSMLSDSSRDPGSFTKSYSTEKKNTTAEISNMSEKTTSPSLSFTNVLSYLISNATVAQVVDIEHAETLSHLPKISISRKSGVFTTLKTDHEIARLSLSESVTVSLDQESHAISTVFHGKTEQYSSSNDVQLTTTARSKDLTVTSVGKTVLTTEPDLPTSTEFLSTYQPQLHTTTGAKISTKAPIEPSSTIMISTSRQITISKSAITYAETRSSRSSLSLQKLTTSQESALLSEASSSSSSSSTRSSTNLFAETMTTTSAADYFHLNGTTTNGTASALASDSGVNIALCVSLSLVFGLVLILILSAIIYCRLQNYCRQFHRCCSKHSSGPCKLTDSYSCVENCNYYGLQQRLSDTPDLISESVHAHVDRLHRMRLGSTNPDEIALLERSLDDQQSLNELDQFVFEDPDLVVPPVELFTDTPTCSGRLTRSEHHSPSSSDEQTDISRVIASGRRRNRRPNRRFLLPNIGHNVSRVKRKRKAAVGQHYDWLQATVVENPYLQPSCHAHSEPGPDWRPFHEYDTVYVPHHDPIGMQRRLDSEGSYVTSPRLRLKRYNPYEEVQASSSTRQLVPVAQVPPSVPQVPPSVPNRGAGYDGFMMHVPVAPTRVSSRPVAYSIVERRLPDTPVSPDPCHDLSLDGQRDSTASNSTVIPGHEYSRVDFGACQQARPVASSTVEVEMYETDSDSCRDGAYESIDFP